MRRSLSCLMMFLLASAATSGEDGRATDGAVAAGNGVVVHGVDAKLLAARLRDVDNKTAGDAKHAADDLAEILSGDTSALVDEGANSYLCGTEACLQRVAALPPDGIAEYRSTVDPRAASILADALARADPATLARHAAEFALSSHGPKLLVALADLRAARGDARLAAQALSDLLRLWPESGATAEMPGVDRASVVLRLASLLASLGDESGVRWLRRETSAKILAGPSPGAPGAKVDDVLARCALAAAARGAAPAAPSGTLRVAAEKEFVRERPGDSAGPPRQREVMERPLPVGTPERPVLVTREPSRSQSRVVALAPAPDAGGALVELWTFPSEEERKAALRRGGRGPFEPARCGDLILFPWPVVPSAGAASGGRSTGPDDEQNVLEALSISGEGRLVDERGGDDETSRDDADADLAASLDSDGRVVRPALSFCGRPLVVGTSVFTTLVRRTENGGATELHVARFDVVADGSAARLRERWRRHVLDGDAMQAEDFSADNQADEPTSLAAPAAMAERLGRVYVASATGAAACVDAADGRVVWVHAYPRRGPSDRRTVLPAPKNPRSVWKNSPVVVDGPWVYAAPRDADFVFQFRAMPRSARTTLVQSWSFLGGHGTSAAAGPCLPGQTPDELLGVADGVGWFSGAAETGGLVPVGSPLSRFRFRDASPGEPRRSYADAQIPESPAAGSPCLVRGALLFPSYKAVYRVALDDFEAAPTTLWRAGSTVHVDPPPDEIGNLVPDGARLWSVTPHRVVLFEPAPDGPK